LFPLSQYDLPSHNSKILSFPRPLLADRINATTHDSTSSTDRSPLPTSDKPDLVPPRITQEQISQNNPDVDYTRYVIYPLVFCHRVDPTFNVLKAGSDIIGLLGRGQFNPGRR
jgi:translation initiation factor eIF-2B subunit alpha